ncbi:MAG: DEAD/DEAH box helicase [Planctomycetota bacterium]
MPTRDDLLVAYLDTIPYEPYPVQEDALVAWFSHRPGVLVCAPTGTGKTLIAEAALFEALHTGKTAYYTTPLIALSEQKFEEIKESAVRWGFSEDDVGLITGNRSVNPHAKVLVVVAEVLLNRLLHPPREGFGDVIAVVMDEFHSFGDPGRGIVWELTLSLLPAHVGLLLLSATVGNAVDFVTWMDRSHGRTLRLVQGTERKVPLQFHWVGEELLPDAIGRLVEDDRTPALVFCFNREECWSVAEQLKGRHLLPESARQELNDAIAEHDWSRGAGSKLRPILLRGVGVHHAGVLPKYKQIVEQLFIRRLLSVVICTETLAAGMNLPARSTVLTTLMKGPPGKKKIVDASNAHQMFGRAGRPQFDTEGHVYAVAHEDDVKIANWHQKNDLEKLEQSKDPLVLKTLKRLKKKMPTRRKSVQYWSEEQFEKLIEAPPAKLASRGQLPWKLLAYLLERSPEVEAIRTIIGKRLLSSGQIETQQKQLTRQLRMLASGGFVTLDPAPPPLPGEKKTEVAVSDESAEGGLFGALIAEAREAAGVGDAQADEKAVRSDPVDDGEPAAGPYRPVTATPTEKMAELLAFRSINPIYGSFLLRHLGRADGEEVVQILESLLEVPGSAVKLVRVPPPDRLPPGPLAREYVDPEVIARGLASQDQLYPDRDDPAVREAMQFPVPLAEKLLMLFQHEFPGVTDVPVRAVRVASDLVLTFGGDFDRYVSGRDLARQEGLIFRHLLRLILLLDEFAEVTPDGVESGEWRSRLKAFGADLERACRKIDPRSTDVALTQAGHEQAEAVAEGSLLAPAASAAGKAVEDEVEFGAGLD